MQATGTTTPTPCSPLSHLEQTEVIRHHLFPHPPVIRPPFFTDHGPRRPTPSQVRAPSLPAHIKAGNPIERHSLRVRHRTIAHFPQLRPSALRPSSTVPVPKLPTLTPRTPPLRPVIRQSRFSRLRAAALDHLPLTPRRVGPPCIAPTRRLRLRLARRPLATLRRRIDSATARSSIGRDPRHPTREPYLL